MAQTRELGLGCRPEKGPTRWAAIAFQVQLLIKEVEQGNLGCIELSIHHIPRGSHHKHTFRAMWRTLMDHLDESTSILLDLPNAGSTFPDHAPYNFHIA